MLLLLLLLLYSSFSLLVESLFNPFYITEQYSLRPNRLFVSVDSNRESCDVVDLLGVWGLGEALDEGLDDDDDFVADDFEADDLVADRLAAAAVVEVLLLDLAELAGFLLVALAGLVGVLKSRSPRPNVKLSSLMGDTEDLSLVAVGFLVEDLVADRFALLVDELAVLFFFIEAGVVFALDDFGLGVPLMGFDDLLAGVAVCLAIVAVLLLCMLFSSCFG